MAQLCIISVDIVTSLKKAAYKKMDETKDKFRKAYDDQEKATAAYNKANDDGNVTRNEVN